MQDLKIAFVQTRLHWEDSKANQLHFSRLIASLKTQPDLIVLPETFNTGFPVDPRKWAEKPDGSSFKWLQHKAVETGAVICASMLMESGEEYHNSLIWMRPDGSHRLYNKRHVFRMGGEHERISPGDGHLLTRLKGWNIRPLVCYDLRFPVWCKNTYDNGHFEYDFMIFVANWPAVRTLPWKQLLIARAIENQAYVLGVNRIGTDGLGIDYAGDSCLIDPKGQIIAQAKSGEEAIIEESISLNELDSFRKKFNVGMDWDRFKIVF
jgi:omega-amidase